ncbi:hypothetical protein U9M48_001469 [Paspalum notatum var. saurae]|uniref:SAM domain-containing protein n=1 Tax=Paspalum notatum var. saurae TaxID=547442 RepID=A0AAQ3SGR1_PASNO
MSRGRSPEPLDFFIWTVQHRPLLENSANNDEWTVNVPQDVGLWLEEINLGSYRQAFEENVACLKGEQEVRRPWWAPSCLSVVFVRVAKRNRQSRVVSLKLEA